MGRREFIAGLGSTAAWSVAARELGWIVALVFFLGEPTAPRAQTGLFVAPPRTIAEITAILDQEKPDPVKAAKLRSEADDDPPATKDSRSLAKFYYERALVRGFLGRPRDAIADCEKAIALHSDFSPEVGRYEDWLAAQYSAVGDFKRAIELDLSLVRKWERINRKDALFFVYYRIIGEYLALRDLDQAEIYAKKSRALLTESKTWKNVDPFRSWWEGNVEDGAGSVFEARGHFHEAELSYHKAQSLLRDTVVKSASWPNPPAVGIFGARADAATASEGRMKQAQGRLAEAEIDIRAALLGRLKAVGKFNPRTAEVSRILANLLRDRTRYKEAERLARASVEIYRELGYREDAPGLPAALNELASDLQWQGRWNEAADIYAMLDVATKDWEPLRRERLRLSSDRIFTEYRTGKVDTGIELARAQAARTGETFGDKHMGFALAQGNLGLGLVLAHRDDEAMQVYKTALPILFGSSQRAGGDDSATTLSYDRYIQNLTQPYLSLLARRANASADTVEEGLQLGEWIRGRSVQKAVAEASTRILARDPALAELARKEQDLRKQIGAQSGAVNNQLMLPPEQRDNKVLSELRNQVEKLQAEHTKQRLEIGRRFPRYADLIDPRPPTLAAIKASLRPDEALMSFFFGNQSSFVWAVPKAGPPAFAEIKTTAGGLAAKIKKLREGLEPDASTIGDIPPFDVALAHDLYQLLLAPVEASWKPAKHLIVVTNGALGTLPLALLPTAPAAMNLDEGPLFAGYRNVAWLARTHSVTMMPSSGTLETLTQLPAGSKTREPMIGFGDPIFNEEQAAEVAKPIQTAMATTRGMPLVRRSSPRYDGVDSAEFALLPRLPDTAEELRSIARALNADSSRVLKLGLQANEQVVKSTDLSKYKVILFATHGLVPGELDGLTQPALALSAPNVAGVAGDG